MAAEVYSDLSLRMLDGFSRLLGEYAQMAKYSPEYQQAWQQALDFRQLSPKLQQQLKVAEIAKRIKRSGFRSKKEWFVSSEAPDEAEVFKNLLKNVFNLLEDMNVAFDESGIPSSIVSGIFQVFETEKVANPVFFDQLESWLVVTDYLLFTNFMDRLELALETSQEFEWPVHIDYFSSYLTGINLDEQLAKEMIERFETAHANLGQMVDQISANGAVSEGQLNQLLNSSADLDLFRQIVYTV